MLLYLLLLLSNGMIEKLLGFDDMTMFAWAIAIYAANLSDCCA